MMNEFTMRFLIIGSIITILIGFGVWWFFIHSSSDRIVEESGIKFVKAVDAACETNRIVEINFEMPQPFAGSLKERTEEFFREVQKMIGIGGTEINIPFQMFNDPYYKVYWEYFPPDPPYSFGEGVLETAASIFAPWSEDLPWTSNFMATVLIDSFTLGIDIFGFGKITGGIASKGKAAMSLFRKKLEGISPELFEKATKAWNAIQEAADIVIENFGKAGKLVIKGGKIVVKEGKFIGVVTSTYTVFCLVTQDKTLGECLKEGVILGFGADVAKVVTEKYVYPKLKLKLEAKIEGIKARFSIKWEEFKRSFYSSVDETIDEDIIPSLKEEVGKKRWQYDPELKKFRANIDNERAREEVINPLQEYVDSKGYPDRVDDFTIIYDKDGKTIKEVIYDPKSITDKLKEKILYPIEEKLGRLSEKVMSNRMLDSGSFKEFSEFSKEYFEKNPERAKEFLRLAGIKVENSDEALRILSQRFSRIEREVQEDIFFVVVEKDSKLEKLIDKLDDIKLSSLDVYHDQRHAVREYLYKIIENSDKDEAKKLWNLLNGKRLRIKEDVEVFSRGTFGYMILRIQDLYTPLGATYWDRYFSYYGYPSLEVQKKGFCQTQCEDGKICVQLGACVRAFDLPESCVDKGISSIKLKRNSTVAKDPRFYLVSPCYSKLKIYVEGDTVYVEPYMKADDKKNYCYATAGLVNWYIGSEIAVYITKCVSAALCAVFTTGAGVVDAVLACVGLGKGFTGVCSIVTNLAGMIVDIFRETTLVYPDVYKNMPYLIDFKL